MIARINEGAIVRGERRCLDGELPRGCPVNAKRIQPDDHIGFQIRLCLRVFGLENAERPHLHQAVYLIVDFPADEDFAPAGPNRVGVWGSIFRSFTRVPFLLPLSSTQHAPS